MFASLILMSFACLCKLSNLRHINIWGSIFWHLIASRPLNIKSLYFCTIPLAETNALLLRQYWKQPFPCSALFFYKDQTLYRIWKNSDDKILNRCIPESDTERIPATLRVLSAQVHTCANSIFFNNVQNKATLVICGSLICKDVLFKYVSWEDFSGNFRTTSLPVSKMWQDRHWGRNLFTSRFT